MMNGKVLFLLALVAAVTADGDSHSHEDQYNGYYDEPNYEYHYNVHDNYGNNHGKQESRHGSRTYGSYYVLLPDKRLQKVYYFVNGDSGYVADVRYDRVGYYDSHESYEDRNGYRSKEDSRQDSREAYYKFGARIL